MRFRSVFASLFLLFFISVSSIPAESASFERYVVYNLHAVDLDSKHLIKINYKMDYAVVSKPVEGVKFEKDVVVKALFPNDPKYILQWHLKSINTDKAWDYVTGNPEIIVAVIDTGVDYNHPDLKRNIWVNKDEVPSNGIDDDGNGYVDDYYGYDFVNNDGDPIDDNGHGTVVAGIIAAEINNSLGVAGIAQVKIMVLKVLDRNGSGYESDVAEAIRYAVDNGANIVSMSLGGSEYIKLLEDACNYAWNKNVLLVAASGNDGGKDIDYPAKFQSVIAVGSVNQEDKLSSFSDFGREQELVAPGEGILSTYTGMSYKSMSGTSAATPQVSGVAALLLSVNPTLSNRDVRKILQQSADDLGFRGKDSVYGYGKVNASRAVSIAPLRNEVHGKVQGFEFRVKGNPKVMGDGLLNVSWTGDGELRIVKADNILWNKSLTSGGTFLLPIKDYKPGGYMLIGMKNDWVVGTFYFYVNEGPEASVKSIFPDEIIFRNDTFIDVCLDNTGQSGYYLLEITLNSTFVGYQLIYLNGSGEFCVPIALEINKSGVYNISVNGYWEIIRVVAPPAFNFTYTLSKPEIGIGEPIDILACVVNYGFGANYTFNFSADGTIVASKTVFVSENEKRCVNFSYTFNSTGTHAISINGITRTVNVTGGFLPEVRYNLSPLEGFAPLEVTISVEIANTGDVAGTFPITLLINNITVKRAAVSLKPGESVLLKYTYVFEEGGKYAVSINNLRAINVTVYSPVSWDSDGDGWNDTIESIITIYYPVFDPVTSVPGKEDLLNAIVNAVSEYFVTDDSTRQEEILGNITQLVMAYFEHF